MVQDAVTQGQDVFIVPQLEASHRLHRLRAQQLEGELSCLQAEQARAEALAEDVARALAAGAMARGGRGLAAQRGGAAPVARLEAQLQRCWEYAVAAGERIERLEARATRLEARLQEDQAAGGGGGQELELLQQRLRGSQAGNRLAIKAKQAAEAELQAALARLERVQERVAQLQQQLEEQRQQRQQHQQHCQGHQDDAPDAPDAPKKDQKQKQIRHQQPHPHQHQHQQSKHQGVRQQCNQDGATQPAHAAQQAAGAVKAPAGRGPNCRNGR